MLVKFPLPRVLSLVAILEVEVIVSRPVNVLTVPGSNVPKLILVPISHAELILITSGIIKSAVE